VESRAEIETCVVAPDLLTSRVGQETVDRLREAGTPVLEVTAEVFRSLSAKEGPQGIGAVVRQRWLPLADADPEEGLCWVALDAVQDPGNLGTVLRTSDAVGGAGVILLGQTTDPYDPGALRASMGAVFTQRLVRAGFDQLLSWKDAHGCSLVGTSDAADAEYREVSYGPRLILLMGSERQGLSREQQAQCDLVVRIPMAGKSDSLNLAVASGVMLYEIFHQRRVMGEKA
jgi:TrmH family RNA methyltransferase